ncbi:MAG TPA: hypothetical protein VL175_12910 [Pirellulales bacterium]|jgi:hypothetical protein|nr:hypothetical protein [Pirellulales bacterium]
MSRDDEFRDYLSQHGVRCESLDRTSRDDAENRWREIYGEAFAEQSRLRQGAKAEHAYQEQACTHYLVVPFSSDVKGLPINFVGRSLEAYECSGTLVSLRLFHSVEFFVCPVDFSWTMVYTHEDYGCGGPFFVRREWLPEES